MSKKSELKRAFFLWYGLEKKKHLKKETELATRIIESFSWMTDSQPCTNYFSFT